MLIDEFLPVYDAVEDHQIDIHPPVEQVYAAVRTLRLLCRCGKVLAFSPWPLEYNRARAGVNFPAGPLRESWTIPKMGQNAPFWPFLTSFHPKPPS